jgi:hypothetical protein
LAAMGKNLLIAGLLDFMHSWFVQHVSFFRSAHLRCGLLIFKMVHLPNLVSSRAFPPWWTKFTGRLPQMTEKKGPTRTQANGRHDTSRPGTTRSIHTVASLVGIRFLGANPKVSHEFGSVPWSVRAAIGIRHSCVGQARVQFEKKHRSSSRPPARPAYM